jgi:hypothetical protein
MPQLPFLWACMSDSAVAELLAWYLEINSPSMAELNLVGVNSADTADMCRVGDYGGLI